MLDSRAPNESREATAAGLCVYDGAVDSLPRCRRFLLRRLAWPAYHSPRLWLRFAFDHLRQWHMKKNIILILVFFVAGCTRGQEQMTPEHFRALVATTGDSKPLRPELAPLPHWKSAKCRVTLNFQDGRVFKEEMPQTAKTIDGNYIVFSADSQFYKQRMHSIVGYDDTAHAIKQWALFGETLTEETMLYDFDKKISASTSRYAGGFMEITVASFSEKELSGRALAYKDGVLYLTREVTISPAGVDGSTNASPSIRSETNSTSSAAGSRR